MTTEKNSAAHGSPAEPADTSAFPSSDFAGSVADIAELEPEERDVIAALPRNSALLIVRRGPDQGARYLLDHDVNVAGRHPDSDIFLDDVTVSRQHAEFRRTPHGFEAHDLGSLNGTYVAGQLVDRAALIDGIEVMVGKFRLTYFGSRQGMGA
jgi:pSer/pThr/pTyr-binding forkhead associated (FHA) protein